MVILKISMFFKTLHGIKQIPTSSFSIHLNDEIVALQKQSDDFANQKGEKTREFTLHFPSLEFEIFKGLPEDTGIDNKIKEIEKEIKFDQKAADTIREHNS